VASHNGLGTGHILSFGSEEQKQKYLPRAASGEWLAAWALTEPGSGLRLGGAGDDRRARRRHWVINGTKMFITQGSVGGFCVVLARTTKDVPEAEGGHGLRGRARDARLPGVEAPREARHALQRHLRADLRERAGARRAPHRRGDQGSSTR
jgi:alkylation response protein AidB-like acyl-CoA dehydrogenase